MGQAGSRLDSHPIPVFRCLATTAMLCPITRQLGLLILLLFCLGCRKESESVVSIAFHPTNANILYVATNDAVYKAHVSFVNQFVFHPGSG